MKRSTRLKLWFGGASALALGAWAALRSSRGRGARLLDALRAQAAAERAARPRVPAFAFPPKTGAEAAARRAALLKARPDADWAADGYSRGSWQVVNQPDSGAWVYSRSGWQKGVDPAKLGFALDATGNAGRPIDEFGRPWHGVSGNPLAPVLAAAQIALPFVPGVGPAASAALAASIALAKGKSLKDVALSAARNAVPGGAAGQLAFDVGVAVASGERIDAAAADALLARVPTSDRAFEIGADAVLSPEQSASARNVKAAL